MKTRISKAWTKKKLLKALEGVPDNAPIFIISSDYSFTDDATWDASTQASLDKFHFDGSDVFFRLDVSMFD